MTNAPETPTYATYWVSVTFKNGREAARKFLRRDDAQRYFDKRVQSGKACNVMMSGTTSDGECDGLDGWWAK